MGCNDFVVVAVVVIAVVVVADVDVAAGDVVDVDVDVALDDNGDVIVAVGCEDPMSSKLFADVRVAYPFADYELQAPSRKPRNVHAREIRDQVKRLRIYIDY